MAPRPRNNDPDTRLSRFLSKVLRHQAAEMGLDISSDGYVLVSDLLNLQFLKSSKTSVEDVKRVVENNDKKRYTLSVINDKLYIRANQGHSIKVEDLELKPLVSIDDFPNGIAVHGTTKRAWLNGIKDQGLSRMKRNHIHMASGLNGADGVISGMRKNLVDPVHIYIDLPRALDAGLKFFASGNGVILSPGNQEGFIPVDLFLKVDGI